MFEVARWELMAVRLLPDAPEAPAWAAEARQLFESVGARPFPEKLDAATSASPTSATAAAPAASEPVAEHS